jgi:hypothetical protein
MNKFEVSSQEVVRFENNENYNLWRDPLLNLKRVAG